VDAGVPCLFLYSLQQGIGVRRQPTVDHERAVFAAQRNDIAPGTLEQRETAA